MLTGGADTLHGVAGSNLNSRAGTEGNDPLNGGPGTDRCVTDARERSVRSSP